MPFHLKLRARRTCVREDVREIKDAQMVLNRKAYRYNYRQVHSTTPGDPLSSSSKGFKREAVSL